ncbi:hypothetical protein SAMN05216480_102277 [Pustulibacterium marinum]|uniref:DUF6891 domain-containing protein n=1 Tax=Pustulibacterium marinum TaxID=1224947 RepID=A0A1I7FVS2_9FLAO|nr:hypothetical protein [Pustulibacterium marinum]SFU40240.1 hypothetical protein SAMN05216480_102277 [Pustulibacterium marinum]
MDKLIQKDIIQIIKEEIAIGFKEPMEIFDVVLDTFNEISLDEDWVSKTIDEQYTINIEDSKTWHHPTDFEKLRNVFNELIEKGIVALHNAGYTRNDCLSECHSVIQELDFFEEHIKGFCYYSTQDIKRIIHIKNPLFIGFQALNENESLSIEIGNIIVEELKKQDFEVLWNGNLASRIEVINFDWKKIPDKTDYDYKNVIHRLNHYKKSQKPKKKSLWKFWKL